MDGQRPSTAPCTKKCPGAVHRKSPESTPCSCAGAGKGSSKQQRHARLTFLLLGGKELSPSRSACPQCPCRLLSLALLPCLLLDQARVPLPNGRIGPQHAQPGSRLLVRLPLGCHTLHVGGSSGSLWLRHAVFSSSLTGGSRYLLGTQRGRAQLEAWHSLRLGPRHLPRLHWLQVCCLLGLGLGLGPDGALVHPRLVRVQACATSWRRWLGWPSRATVLLPDVEQDVGPLGQRLPLSHLQGSWAGDRWRREAGWLLFYREVQVCKAGWLLLC